MAHNFQAIFMASPVPQIVLLPDEPNFTIVGANDAYQKVTGFTESELVGKPVFEAFPANPGAPNSDSVLKQFRSSLKHIIATKQPLKLDVVKYDLPERDSCKFITRYWIPSLSPVLNDRGEVDYIISSPIDVTEKTLTEQKAASDRLQLQDETSKRIKVQQQVASEKTISDSLIDCLPGIFYLFDEEGKLSRWNESVEDLTGYSAQEIKRKNVLDFFADDHVDYIKERVEEGFITGKSKAEAPLVLKDGRTMPFMFCSTAVELNGKKHLLGIGIENTDRLMVEKQIKSSLKEKEVLLSEIHHRVKNNLAIISSLLDIQAQTLDSDHMKGILEECEGRIHAMAMIHELLYQHDDFSSIDFGDYVSKLLVHISSSYDSSGKVIETRVKTEPVYLEISTAIPCGLIAHELITNAYKHAFTGRDEGRIKISLKRMDSEVTLVISDNGVGMPTKRENNSIGFMLIRGLTNQIGGEISSTSVNGTTFTLKLPAVGIPETSEYVSPVHHMEK